MPELHVSPVAVIHNSRKEPSDDAWDSLVSEIRLAPSLPADSLVGLEAFSHVEIVFQFHLVQETDIVVAMRHPRENPLWPEIGIFAQRGRLRPNRLGVSVARFLRREGRSLFVQGLDAVDGTPVLDIKPVMLEFLPRGEITQPDWSHELMKGYWE